jgi:hypothetical protein
MLGGETEMLWFVAVWVVFAVLFIRQCGETCQRFRHLETPQRVLPVFPDSGHCC